MFNKRLSYLCITSFLIFLNACGGGEEKSPEDNQGAHNPPLIEQKPKKEPEKPTILEPVKKPDKKTYDTTPKDKDTTEKGAKLDLKKLNQALTDYVDLAWLSVNTAKITSKFSDKFKKLEDQISNSDLFKIIASTSAEELMKKIKLPGSSDQASLLWHFVTRLYKLAKTNPTSSDEGWERVGVWSGFGLFEDTRDIKAVILTTELSIHLKDKFKLSQDAWDKWVMEGEPEGKDNVVKLTLETVNAQFPALFEDKDTALDAFQVAK